MFDFLGFGFMQRALLSAVVTGLSCSLMGVFVVLQGLSFVGAGIAHGAFAGVALALLLGYSPMAGATVTALVMALAIGYTKRRGKLNLDASVGIAFSGALALAVFFIGLLPGYNADLMGYLFGNLLSVSAEDLWIGAGIGVLVLVCLFLFFKELQFVTFDPEMAEASGLPVAQIFDGLLLLVALAIVISLKAAGELLVMAFIVIPASAAWQWSSSLKTMLLLSGSFGVFSAVAGLLISFYFDIPSGASIVLLLILIFLGSSILARWRVQVGTGVPLKSEVE